MNRAILPNAPTSSHEDLPPARRHGPVRLLLVNSLNLGFAAQAAQVRKYTAARGDVRAVHVDLVHPLWVRGLGKTVPAMRGWDFSAWRYLAMYRRVMNRWLAPGGRLSAEQFDVIHVTTQGVAMGVVDLKRRVGNRVKCSVYCDSTAALEVREFGAPRLAAEPMRRAEARIFAAADLVVCMSEWAARSVREDYGVPAARVHVAPGCVPLPPGRVHDAATGGLPRLVFVGNDWHRKGGPILLAAHQARFAERAELHVVSAGARPDRSARNVVWHGAVPRARLLGELLPSMDVFVLPTRFDMSPWAVLEAAAAGLPVVSTRLAAIPEMVADGETGLLVSPGDTAALEAALEHLVTDPELRRRMGGAARRHVAARYDADRVYNGLIDRLVRLADDP